MPNHCAVFGCNATSEKTKIAISSPTTRNQSENTVVKMVTENIILRANTPMFVLIILLMTGDEIKNYTGIEGSIFHAVMKMIEECQPLNYSSQLNLSTTGSITSHD